MVRTPTIYLSKIHILQKQIIRTISHAEIRSHTYVLVKTHQIMKIYQLNKYVTCILMYKHNRGMLPNIFNDMLMKHTPSHNYNMRHIAYKIPHCKTYTKQNTLTYVGQKLWNIIIMKNHIIYEHIKTGNETIHPKNILTRNTAQLRYSSIIQCDSMYV